VFPPFSSKLGGFDAASFCDPTPDGPNEEMCEADWAITLEAFRGCCSGRGDKGGDDRLFLEALHYFVVPNVT
jgi:hypothetical protein